MKNLALALAVVAAVISLISLGNVRGFKMNKSYSQSNEVSIGSSEDVSRKSMESLFENVSEDVRKNMENFVLRYDAEGDPYSEYNRELIFKLKNNIPIE